MENFIKNIENKEKVGFDQNSKLWFPHKSSEGGKPTIAYGHKLGNDLGHYKSGISDKDAEDLLKHDLELARKIVYIYIEKKYKVKWVDIHSFSEWTSKEEILKSPPTVIESLYIYIGKGKGGLCFAGEFNGDEYGNVTILPKEVIKKIIQIK